MMCVNTRLSVCVCVCLGERWRVSPIRLPWRPTRRKMTTRTNQTRRWAVNETSCVDSWLLFKSGDGNYVTTAFPVSRTQTLPSFSFISRKAIVSSRCKSSLMLRLDAISCVDSNRRLIFRSNRNQNEKSMVMKSGRHIEKR